MFTESQASPGKKKKKSCQGAKQKVPKLLQNFMIQAPEMEEKTKQNRV